MRRLLKVCGVLLFCSLVAEAQVRNSSPDSSAAGEPAPSTARVQPYAAGELSSWQLGASYQYVRFRIAGADRNLNGFHTSFTRYANDWFGLEGALTGAFGSNSARQRTRFLFYGGGLRLAYRRNARVEPWVHGLYGGAHLTPRTALGSVNASAYAAGGGVDLKLTPRAYWRVQADYLGSRFYNQTQQNFQIGTGVVVNF